MKSDLVYDCKVFWCDFSIFEDDQDVCLHHVGPTEKLYYGESAGEGQGLEEGAALHNVNHRLSGRNLVLLGGDLPDLLHL